MRTERAFLTDVLKHISDADEQVRTTIGCAVQGSLYHRALRAIEGSAKMRLIVLDSKDGSKRTSTALPVDTSG